MERNHAQIISPLRS